MKKVSVVLICICYLLSGCSMFGSYMKEPVSFYYVQKDYQEEMQDVIVSERREAAGHRYDLPYLLALYSMGPSSDKLESLFPKNITILPTEHTENGIVLSLSENIGDMTDAEFTLASTCLSLTCMELTTAKQITVTCGHRTVVIREDNLLFSGAEIQMKDEE